MNIISSNVKKVLLSLFLIAVISGVCMANTLSQLDITRSTSSDSSLDVTLYTSSAYTDNVAVTKKSDNKYVILMPNLTSSQTGKPDFNSVKDFISDIDVKSVNDGNGGYTKVTLTTNKPVNIRAKLKNSVPLTPEQKAYKSLITKSRTNPDTPVYIPDSRTYMAKTSIAAAKLEHSAKPTPEPKQVKAKPTVETNKITTTVPAPKKLKAPVKSESKINSVKKEILKEAPQNIQSDKKTSSVENKPVENKITTLDKKVTENKVKSDSNNTTKAKNPKGANTMTDFSLMLAALLIPICGLLLLLKTIKNSIIKSKSLKNSFKENLSNMPKTSNDYKNIITDSNLTWQEKYQKYVKTRVEDENSVKYDVTKEINSEPAITVDNAVAELEKQINKMEINKNTPIISTVDDNENIEKLEKVLHNSPEVEKIVIDENELMKSLEDSEIEVHKEETIISKNMSEVSKISAPKKLKAFANKIALEETFRVKPLPKTREEIKNTKNIESKYVELGNSELYSNNRSFEGGNLSVADLISKSNRFIQNAKPNNNLKIENKTKKKVFENDKGYEIATLDEFFSLPESNRATASSELSNKVAQSLSGLKPSIKLQKTDFGKLTSTNSFKSDKNDNVLNGLIVKSGVNLDDKKGLYVVNLDGQTALVGRIGNDVFVLKKFDKNVERPIQVRHDDANVYMVKADKYRSLVQVNENNMDVLVEL